MGDTHTRKLDVGPGDRSFSEFLDTHRAVIVVLSGHAAGSEFDLDRPKLAIGRGPGVDLAFEDSAMSREHAVIEYSDGSFRIRDLGSTNGTEVNGQTVKARSLGHGDRIRVGEHVFQFLLETLERAPKTYVVEDA